MGMNKLNNADTLRFRVAELHDGIWTIQEISLYWFEEWSIRDANDLAGCTTIDVSRFTGLHDGAGVEIGEGDLLQYCISPPRAVVFKSGAFGEDAGGDRFIGFEGHNVSYDLNDYLSSCRVVGNVWDGVTKQEGEA